MPTFLIDTRDSVTIIRISDRDMGELQQMEAMCQQLQASLAQSQSKHLLVDLQGVAFVTSAMVGQLIQLIQKFKALNVGVMFCRPNVAIRDVMRIIWFDKVAPVFATEEDALLACRDDQSNSQLDYMSAAAQEEVADLRKKVDAGDAAAQYRLGWCLENGYGVQQNSHDAFRIYGLAAMQSNAEALFALATFHAYAITVPQDYEEATRLYQQAAELGLAEAQYVTGMNYDFGIGLEEDRSLALEWYRKAANQGHQRAQNALRESNP